MKAREISRQLGPDELVVVTGRRGVEGVLTGVASSVRVKAVARRLCGDRGAEHSIMGGGFIFAPRTVLLSWGLNCDIAQERAARLFLAE